MQQDRHFHHFMPEICSANFFFLRLESDFVEETK